MIEINLLPQELKTKGGKGFLDFLPQKQLRNLIPWGIGLLICLHVCLIAINFTRGRQLRLLNDQWRRLEPQRKALETFNKEYDVLSADTNKIQRLTAQRALWSEKLNKLSLKLPSGVWFTELSISGQNFVLKGSAVSLNKQEMALINNFLDKLKADPGFFKDFKSLELTSVKRRTLGGYDIVDFIFSGALK